MTFRSWDLNPRFSVIFPPMIWIFMESEGDKIKSKQGSKRDRTLPVFDIVVLYDSGVDEFLRICCCPGMAEGLIIWEGHSVTKFS